MKQIGLLKAIMLTRKAGKMTAAERAELQKRRLRELVAYAKANSPYYGELYKNVGGSFSLADLPTTNKIALMEHFDDWMTDRSITRKKVDDFMADLSNVGKKLDGKYLVYTTSGSTGNPCVVLYDETTVNVSSAIGVLRSFARKEDFKAYMKQGKKTLALFAEGGFYLASGSVKYNLRKMPWKKNMMKSCDVRRKTQDIVDMMNDFQPTMIGSYPTALELLAFEQEKGKLHVKPAIIMTGGEHLSDAVRERLSKVFGCYVQTNYSCTEGGTVACECRERHFHVNDDWVILEAVDENNQPVPFGTQSSKVLLTNLANKTCPFIRFEITDRIVMHKEACPCGNYRPWLTIEGRTDDILTFGNGVKIAPLSLYAILKEIHGIQRFQLIQTGRDVLELRLVATDKEQLFEQARQALAEYLAQNGVDCEIRLSDKLPEADARSGKFKHVIAMVK
ncbi:MAG: AMP-binding protein [Treponemataceae bacterium]|nr:AMP-binding protein [Treponemataceae bacterium]